MPFTTFTIVCAQPKHIHIPKRIKRMESSTRHKITRVAKVFDQIAREDVSYIKKRIPKVSFYKEETEMDVEIVDDNYMNFDNDENKPENNDIYDDLL